MEITKEKNKKRAWPTKDVMQQIYVLNFWGENNTPFYSGEGSHAEEIVAPYIKVVQFFLNEFKCQLSICDLGCGDFNIGQQLLPFTKQYTAVDIVPELITYNKKKFKYFNLTFSLLDISKDLLPVADCVIIRQVLQHLSNSEVKRIAKKLNQYKYIILTEHIPNGDFVPNIDIISGRGIRLKKNSGVDIECTPFNFKFQDSKVLHQIDLGTKRGIIKTILYTI